MFFPYFYLYMIHFNQLTISPDGKYLIVDVTVDSGQDFENVYIGGIKIDNQDSYSCPWRPSANLEYEEELPKGTEEEPIKYKHYRWEINAKFLAHKTLDGIFYIYIYARDGSLPDISTPCGEDSTYTFGVVCNMYPFYQQAVNYIKETNRQCKPPQNFIDYILKFKALELAIRTGNYIEANEFYNKYFLGQGKSSVINGGCGCAKNT